MTTAQQEIAYRLEHLAQWGNKPPVVFNPNDKEIDELPVIYGFNNGGQEGWLQAVLIAEDGTPMGSHICSAEAYMPHDLGIVEGSRPDRHEGFQAHYPDGYRMEFIGYEAAAAHEGLKAAFEAHQAQQGENDAN